MIRSAAAARPRVWTSASTAALLIGLTVLSLGLRLYDLDANGLSLDEVFSVWLAERGAGDIVVGILRDGAEATPPTYYVLLHAFMQLGSDLLLVRAPSIIAGLLIVLLTFRIAAELFDQRVAGLAALLVAIAPLQIALSRTARGYTLAALFALAGVYFLARILLLNGGRRDWTGLVVATVAALYTHYLMFLFLVFANAVVAAFWLAGAAPRRVVGRWILAQALVFVAMLPAVYSVMSVRSESQAWLGRPGAEALLRGLILMATGNPSYGYSATGVTPARLLALVTVVTIALLGAWTLRSVGRAEARRVLFLVAAFALPWLACFAVGQVRPLYAEKYILFVTPPLAIAFAWALLRTRSALAPLALVALLGVTGQALTVYYTQPYSDQFREVVASVRPAVKPDDLIVLSPAYFGRPFGYYFYGGRIPAAAAVRGTVPALQVRDGQMALFDPSSLATARRVWVLSGGPDAPPRPLVTGALEPRFAPVAETQLVGATARLWERKEDDAR